MCPFHGQVVALPLEALCFLVGWSILLSRQTTKSPPPYLLHWPPGPSISAHPEWAGLLLVPPSVLR